MIETDGERELGKSEVAAGPDEDETFWPEPYTAAMNTRWSEHL